MTRLEAAMTGPEGVMLMNASELDSALELGVDTGPILWEEVRAVRIIREERSKKQIEDSKKDGR